jgi:hypothetical protein
MESVRNLKITQTFLDGSRVLIKYCPVKVNPPQRAGIFPINTNATYIQSNFRSLAETTRRIHAPAQSDGL